MLHLLLIIIYWFRISFTWVFFFSSTISRNQLIHPAACRNQSVSLLNDEVPSFCSYSEFRMNLISLLNQYITHNEFLRYTNFFPECSHPWNDFMTQRITQDSVCYLTRTHFRVAMYWSTCLNDYSDTEVLVVKSSVSNVS